MVWRNFITGASFVLVVSHSLMAAATVYPAGCRGVEDPTILSSRPCPREMLVQPDAGWIGNDCPPWVCGLNGPALTGTRLETQQAPTASPAVAEHTDTRADAGRTAFVSDECQDIGNCGLNGPALTGTRLEIQKH